MAEDYLIIDNKPGIGEELVDFIAQTGAKVSFVRNDSLCHEVQQAENIVFFLDATISKNQKLVDTLQMLFSQCKTICLVSSFEAHFQDEPLLAVESWVCQASQTANCRMVVFRPSFVLSEKSQCQQWLNRTWFTHFLIPRSFSSCFIDSAELFHAIRTEISRERVPRFRTLTLLGPNRTWKEVFQTKVQLCFLQRILAVVPWILSWLGLSYVIGLVFLFATKIRPSLRRFHFRNLEPTSHEELLALYNPYNYSHIQIAGYNNGVVHFGWQFPQKTVILTRSAGDGVDLKGNTIKVDAGVTLKRAVLVANAGGKEFLVLPNYSYVSIGTAFFVPIHGSGSEVSTLGESIEKVLLYDPVADQIRSLKQTDTEFINWIYNREKPLLLLRLFLRVRDKTAYYAQKTTHESLCGESVWDAFSDADACNIEIRKAGSKTETIDIYKYYHQPPTGMGDALEVPRDSLARLWDRLEENPVSSWLFHWLTRKLGYHVELFLNRDEFLAFWLDHVKLSLAKMQLRLVHQDGLTHSPCAEGDRVSIDVFMIRNRRGDFLNYMRQHLPDARFNPGKHSM